MDINGYHILDKIAEGGMATVYLAENSATQERVALKMLPPELSDDLSVVQRFIDEAEIVSQLEHPAIISVLDAGLSDGFAYMAMEYVPGGNLRERIQSGLTETDIIQIVTRIVEALSHAHLKGILHLDVCPRNILFRNNGDPVLADFGISKKYLEPDFDNPDPVMGNPRYMSPEQIKGERTDPKTDLYSLGVIFYEMLAGCLPYEAESGVKTARMHLYEVPEPLPAHYSHYQTVIDQLLEKIPERRFHSADEVLNALGELHSSVAVLDDKTVIYPLKQSASGHMSHGSQQAATVIDDEEFFEYDHVDMPGNFIDQTDPIPVEEVLDTTQDSPLADKGLEEIDDPFEPPEKTAAQDSPLADKGLEEIADPFEPPEKTAAQDSPLADKGLEEIADPFEPPEKTAAQDSPVADKGLEEIADQFKPPKKTAAADEDTVRLVTLKTDHPAFSHTPASTDTKQALLEIEPESDADEAAITGEYAVDPGVLIAVRDDLSSTPLAEKRFSLLNVVVILAVFSAALWLWSTYRENSLQTSSQQQQSSGERSDQAVTTDTSETEFRPSSPQANDEVKPITNNADSVETNKQAGLPASGQSTTESNVPPQESIETVQKSVSKAASEPADNKTPAEEVSSPGSVATENKPVMGEDDKGSNIPLTEIVLEPDTGIQLSDDQFIISYGLENTLKIHIDKLQREFDGSLKLLLERSEIYQNGSRVLSREGLNLLSRLTYVLRNNQDFMVLVTDRSTGIDSPDSYRISVTSANNIRDFLISQGLPAKRVRSEANSRQYRGNFFGIEIQLIPDIQATIPDTQTSSQ